MAAAGERLAAYASGAALSLRGQCVEFLGQAGLFASGCIFVNKAFGCRFVQLLLCRTVCCFSSVHIRSYDRSVGLFNSRTKSGFSRSVAQAASFVRFGTFDGGFDVWHSFHLQIKQKVFLHTTCNILSCKGAKSKLISHLNPQAKGALFHPMDKDLSMYNIRTDLALEAKELASEDHGASEIPGLWSETDSSDGVTVTRMEIQNEEAAQRIG